MYIDSTNDMMFGINLVNSVDLNDVMTSVDDIGQRLTHDPVLGGPMPLNNTGPRIKDNKMFRASALRDHTLKTIAQ